VILLNVNKVLSVNEMAALSEVGDRPALEHEESL
jgi:hypothetical protein